VDSHHRTHGPCLNSGGHLMTSSIGRLVDPLGILEYVNDFVDSFRRAYRTATANGDMTVTVHCPCGTPWSYPPVGLCRNSFSAKPLALVESPRHLGEHNTRCPQAASGLDRHGSRRKHVLTLRLSPIGEVLSRQAGGAGTHSKWAPALPTRKHY
jgi:hypothetical protein